MRVLSWHAPPRRSFGDFPIAGKATRRRSGEILPSCCRDKFCKRKEGSLRRHRDPHHPLPQGLQQEHMLLSGGQEDVFLHAPLGPPAGQF